MSSERDKNRLEVAKTPGSVQKALRTEGTRLIRLRCSGFSRGVANLSSGLRGSAGAWEEGGARVWGSY